MRYKDKHFYTALEHINYMVKVENLNQTDINHNLREYWKLSNMDIISVMRHYEEQNNKEVE